MAATDWPRLTAPPTPPALTSVPPPVQMAKIDEKIDGLKAELKAAKGLDLVRCVVGAGGKLRYV